MPQRTFINPEGQALTAWVEEGFDPCAFCDATGGMPYDFFEPDGVIDCFICGGKGVLPSSHPYAPSNLVVPDDGA